MAIKQYYPDITNDEYERQFNNIRAIQFKVSLRTGRRSDWIARQQQRDPQKWIGWGFVIDRECLFIPNEDVMHDPEDTAFIDKLAEKMLGYPPDSKQHIEAQIAEVDEWLATLKNEMDKLATRMAGFLDRKAELQQKINQSS